MGPPVRRARPRLVRQNRGVKIICIGRNYAEHAAELGDEPPTEPLIFGKFENTLIGPGEAIVLPPEATHVDAEAELARRDRPAGAAHRRRRRARPRPRLPGRERRLGAEHPVRREPVDAREGLRHVLPARRPSSCPSPSSATAAGLRVMQRLNGEVLQDGNTNDLIFDVPFLDRVRLERVHARAGRPDPHRARRPASAGRASRRSRCRTATSSRWRSKGSGSCRTRSSPRDVAAAPAVRRRRGLVPAAAGRREREARALRRRAGARVDDLVHRRRRGAVPRRRAVLPLERQPRGRRAWWAWVGGLLGAFYVTATVVVPVRDRRRSVLRDPRRSAARDERARRPVRLGRLPAARGLATAASSASRCSIAGALLVRLF